MSVLTVSYLEHIAPGVLVIAALLLLMKGRALSDLRIVLYVWAFSFFRDCMIPAGLWHIGGGAFLWIRFAHSTLDLLGLAVGSAAMVYALVRFEPSLRPLLVWRRRPWSWTIGFGVAGALVVGAPALILGAYVPSWFRGGPVPYELWPALLAVTLVGNLLEEVLFRGFIQGRLEKILPAKRVILASGLSFALAHVFLSSRVAAVSGFVLLGFTFYEGCIAAWLRQRDGILAAALAHGLGVFLAVSGLP
jgi:membrane protease YdiL (CAAX protease family)